MTKMTLCFIIWLVQVMLKWIKSSCIIIVSSMMMVVACIWYSSMDVKYYANTENVHEHEVSFINSAPIMESVCFWKTSIIWVAVLRHILTNFITKGFDGIQDGMIKLKCHKMIFKIRKPKSDHIEFLIKLSRDWPWLEVTCHMTFWSRINQESFRLMKMQSIVLVLVSTWLWLQRPRQWLGQGSSHVQVIMQLRWENQLLMEGQKNLYKFIGNAT